jgi:hypothetical protein
MKRTILLFTALISLHIVYAGAPAPSDTPPTPGKVSKQWLFKPLAAGDVSLEVERIGGEVMLHLYSQNMRNVETIYVEKSSDPTTGFARCKAVKVSDFLVKSKNYIGVTDANPSSSDSDSYYRIRTVSTKGETKTYAAVGLAPLYQIEPTEMVDNK